MRIIAPGAVHYPEISRAQRNMLIRASRRMVDRINFWEQFAKTQNISRDETCERIVTGKRTVPSVYIPEHEEEIVEWRCTEPILGSPKTEASSEASE